MQHSTGRFDASHLRSPDMVLGLALALLAVLPGVLARSWLLLALGVVLAGWIALYYQRTIREPQRRIAGALVPEGDVQGSIQDVAERIDALVDAHAELERIQHEQDETRRLAERLLRQMTAVARGDLAMRADVVDGDLAQVATSFNQVVDEMGTLVEQVSRTSGDAGESTGSLAAVSTRLASGAHQQATLVEASCERLDALRASLMVLTEHASSSLEVSRRAQGDAISGNAAILETMQVMQRIQQDVDAASAVIGRLGDSSREIGAIVQFIAQIARQTNTLALNASIQAARAGEHGRGFAVVAEEVRTLAERSGNATRQIGALVSAIQTDSEEAAQAIETGKGEVDAGVRIVAEAADAVRGIEHGVTDLTGRMQHVVDETHSQVGLAGSIAATMHEIAGMSKTMNEDSVEATASVESLSAVLARLREAVAGFALSRNPGLTVVADGDD